MSGLREAMQDAVAEVRPAGAAVRAWEEAGWVRSRRRRRAVTGAALAAFGALAAAALLGRDVAPGTRTPPAAASPTAPSTGARPPVARLGTAPVWAAPDLAAEAALPRRA